VKRAKVIVVWVAVIAAFSGGGYGIYRWRESAKPAAVTYTTAKVEKRRIVGRVTATGTLQATVTVQVGTQVSGRLAKILVDYNSPVKKGQLVAKIDPQIFQAAAAQANANHASARAGLVRAEAQAKDAELQLARAKALHAQQLASTAELQVAETAFATAAANVDVAKAAIEQARAAQSQAQINLAYTDITSPIDGVVISRSVDVGQTVAASLQAPTLFTIAEDLKKMQVNTNVSEGDIGRLAEGMAAYFTVDAFPGHRFRGKVSQIRNAPQTVQNVVTYDAVIDVDNSELKLRPGMTANVTMVYAEREDTLAVPNTALRFRPPPEVASAASASAGPAGSAPAAAASSGRRPRGRPSAAEENGEKSLWTLDGQTPRSATVRTGLSDGTWTELLDGALKEGDLVVTDANVAGKPGGAGPPAQNTAFRRMF
jgi:HlyD family secretion protein